jgi:hypothetical protein
LGAGNGHALGRGESGWIKRFVGGFQVEGCRGVGLAAHANLRESGLGQEGEEKQKARNQPE